MNTPATPADELQTILQSAYASSAGNTSGALADYIPELAKVVPDSFGLAIASATGSLCAVGDAEVPFTIQSVSKAFTYCMAIELAGREAVLARVGVEPSGDAFNAIEFDPHTRRPFNPMVNAGAITVAGILYDRLGDGAFDAVLDRFSRAAGRRLDMDEAVYSSESATGHRNRAISHLLLATGAVTNRVEPIVDLYFRQCSIRVTAVDLAWMGATLAHMGENPATQDQVFDLRAVRDTQTVMFTCGMYDYSGNWAFDVGIPAKSGVGGGLVGVVNRQLGIGAYSPRLDAKGNSVRGVAAFSALSDELGLHAFDCTNRGSLLVERYMH
ncbi:glutaminase A [Ramlibacter sp. H39-3-26]|uniref:glutaminase A n=1 Tax=Curvibacter soli TaxID=3031331 RepID=UPI0023DAD7A7|nr:glutaminase A [Ramlibacter sp. H39-3-26]MDF1484410.1 glutaminase A [Ramlibacter sp. H39-3-26]